MSDDIRIWEIDDSSKAATPVETTNRMESEHWLEEVLVTNPDMLMPGLTLVGRQTPTDSGLLDLLGVDADGRLVVFELKQEELMRDAVAQAIDYCSYLESLTEADLAAYIAAHSGITFYLPRITLPENVNVYCTHSVVIDSSGVMRVTFFPGAVDVCLEKFQEKRETIPFEFERPPNAPTTKRVSEQWYCRVDSKTWDTHKDALTALANDVLDARQERRRSGTDA